MEEIYAKNEYIPVQDSPRGISGAVLKWIAIITMLIDHIGASILESYLVSEPGQILRAVDYDQFLLTYRIDLVLRGIGRISFPIFCFLLVEGLFYTKKPWKYIGRLGLFALISEIPFDMAFRSGWWDMSYQNVFFTLLISLVTIYFMEYLRKNMGTSVGKILLVAFLDIVLLAVACLLAYMLHTDYRHAGVLAMVLMYFIRRPVQPDEAYVNDPRKNVISIILGVVVLGLMTSELEYIALIDIIPIYFYNGSRGKQMRYLFYIIYPAHLFIYGLIKYLLIGSF